MGLFAAYYTGFRDLSCKIIDCLPQIGGQLTTLYPQKFVYDVAGFPKILATELALNLHKQAQQYNPKICLEEKVQQIKDLFDKLGKYRITHGDLKHLNILITDNGPVLTDLDGMKVHKCNWIYKLRRARDLQRFGKCRLSGSTNFLHS